MKLTFLMSVLVFASAYVSENASASRADKYYCKDTGNGACAVSYAHGQCGPSWDDEDGGMRACRNWTGESVANKVDRSNYTCRVTTNGACAVDIRTGQCTHQWDREDGGLYQCQRWTGEISNKNIDKSNYVCKKTTNGYCAQDIRTGQCTHEWNYRDGGDAKFQCNRWLRN